MTVTVELRDPLAASVVIKPQDKRPVTLGTAAAAKILRAIRRGRTRYGFPWPMHIAMRLVRALPGPLYDWAAGAVARRVPEPRKAQPGG